MQSYPCKIFDARGIAVAISTILVAFVFPITGFYQPDPVPVFVSPFLGIGFFLTGVIYESKLIRYCSFSWWIGAVLMAYLGGCIRLYIMIAIMIIGYIVPGILLNAQYKQKPDRHAN